jgi:hypothetical protein
MVIKRTFVQPSVIASSGILIPPTLGLPLVVNQWHPAGGVKCLFDATSSLWSWLQDSMPGFVWSRIVCECYVFSRISIKGVTETLSCSSVSLMTRQAIVLERLDHSSINLLTCLLATEDFCWIQPACNVYSQHLYLKVETIPSFGFSRNTLTENRRHFNLNPPHQWLTSRSERLVHFIIRRSNLHAHS